MTRHLLIACVYTSLAVGCSPPSGPLEGTTALSVKADLQEIRRIVDAYGLNKDAAEYIHANKRHFGAPGRDLMVHEIHEACQSLEGQPKWMKGTGKCAIKQARAAKAAMRRGYVRGLGTFGIALTVFFFADEARADGVCAAAGTSFRNDTGAGMATAPLVEFIENGTRLFEAWSEADLNNASKVADRLTTDRFPRVMTGDEDGGVSVEDKDPVAVANCAQALYNQMQARIYVRVAGRSARDLDLSFLDTPGYFDDLHDAYQACLEAIPDRPAVDCDAHCATRGCDLTCSTGCTDPNASNFDPSADEDDGMCEFAGCTNPSDPRFDPLATDDDGSCEGEPDCSDGTCGVTGCMDPSDPNFDSAATSDDGTCAAVPGCTDPAAANYDPRATIDDGMCGAADMF